MDYFSTLVGWWEEWQLRSLVLCSLFLQYFLFIAAFLHKYNIPSWLRFFTWLAYIGGDAIAIYALATLFNRHKQVDCAHVPSIEIIWAPILLMHLGGQDGITAYNIEDNELWMRHVLTALSQVTVALYVFWKSLLWLDEDALWKASLLAFVPGILKSFEKPWALKNASITSLTAMSPPVDNGDINTLEAYVEAAIGLFQEDIQLVPNDMDHKPYTLFVDIVNSYDDRLRNLSYMRCNRDEAYGVVQSGLSSTFDRLYTKERVFRYTPNYDCNYSGPILIINRARIGTILRYLVAYLSLHAIRVFSTGDYSNYNGIDFMVTNILLWGTTALEYLIGNVKPFLECCGIVFRLPWPNQVAQYNLIGYMARNRRHRVLRKLAAFVACKGTLDQLWSVEPCTSPRDITELVYDHVAEGWEHYITNTETYIGFNDSRGQRTLEREGHLELLVYINRPFDEAVLLWHLATEFCFHSMDEAGEVVGEMIRRSREISNYLVYLLFVKSDMLMTGTRSNLFKTTYRSLKRLIQLDAIEGPALDERAITLMIVVEMGRIEPGEGGLARHAHGLAEALRVVGRDDAGAAWRIIRGVWVEMLCFSAGRCRGYLHAKSLGKGGEYLSHVWLLLSHMGMETLAERVQRTEQPDEPPAPVPRGEDNV